MKKEKSSAMGTPYTFEGRIPLKQAIPLGLQHVMAMFVGNLTPLLIIMGACGLTADAGYGALRTALLQNAMTVAGIVTLVQMFSIGPIGGKVPIVMGTSSGFLGVFKSVTAVLGQGALTYGAILGARTASIPAATTAGTVSGRLASIISAAVPARTITVPCRICSLEWLF